jgi:octaprenyl-diphosphate synthase
MESTRQSALDWSARAKDALRVLPAGDLRDMLDDLAEFVVERVA